MARWTTQTTTWVVVVVFVGLMGLAVEISEAKDLDVCQSSCSAAPVDLWPYCCETHGTCCEQFADSCIHDCLPRVSSGDVSAVEERPGLCCALYNLCCFRETPRISSIRNGGHVIQPENIPMTHRFSTLPGGPTRYRQSSVVIPQKAKLTVSDTPKSVQPQEQNSNRRPGSFNRPKPARNTGSSFRDSERSNVQEDTRLGTFSRSEENKRPNHRFDIKDFNSGRPSTTENSKPEEKEKEQSSWPKRPTRLQNFNRPSLPRPVETTKIDKPDAKEPTEEQTNNNPKALDRPGTGKLSRPAPISRPTNPRKITKPEPETGKLPEKDTREEERKFGKPSFLSRPLQPRTLTGLESDQSSTQQKVIQTEPVKVDRPNKLGRPRSMVRIGETRKNTRPALEVTEKIEKVSTPETNDRPRGPRLLINRPNIKKLRLESDVDTSLKPVKDSDQESSSSDVTKVSVKEETTDSPLETENTKQDKPSRVNAYLPVKTVKPIVEEVEKSPTEEVTRTENVPSIRRIKRIRTRGPTRTTQSQGGSSKPLQESTTSDSLKTNAETLRVTPTIRSQGTRGRSRGRQEVTTFKPQLTQERTRGRTQGTPEISRSFQEVTTFKPHLTQESTRGHTQGTQKISRGFQEVTTFKPQLTQERTMGHTQVAQKISSGNTQVAQASSRDRSQVKQERSEGRLQVARETTKFPRPVTSNRPTDRAQGHNEKSEVEKDSTNNPSVKEKVEEMQKEIKEMSTDTPVSQKMDKKTTDDTKSMTDNPDDESQGTDTVMTETPKPKERTMQVQIKKIKLIRPPVAGGRSPPQQPHEAKQKVDEPQAMNPKEDQPQVKEISDRLPVPIQSPKPQQTTKSSEPQSVTRQRSGAQSATRQSSEPQQTRQRTSAQPATRQSSEPQQTRQRTSAQPATRQRSDRQPAESRSTTRRRGRLTARQQLALSGSGDES